MSRFICYESLTGMIRHKGPHRIRGRDHPPDMIRGSDPRIWKIRIYGPPPDGLRNDHHPPDRIRGRDHPPDRIRVKQDIGNDRFGNTTSYIIESIKHSGGTLTNLTRGRPGSRGDPRGDPHTRGKPDLRCHCILE